MANLLMIYDNEDEKMGYYFEASHQDINDRLVNHLTNINLHSLNTEQCLANPIEHYISAFNANPFIFIAYSHGWDDAIDIGGNQYINPKNAYFFTETLFYACSCLTAKTLGGHLRNQGCRVFMGFNTIITSVYNETDTVFQECENTFILHFLTTNATIQESLKYMYKKYGQSQSFLREHYDTFTASTLGANLSSFEILCDEADLLLDKTFFSKKQES